MSTQGKHTPGPWLIGKSAPDLPPFHTTIRDEDGMGWDVAHCFGEKQEANARLIAAAPDLLEACEAAFIAVEPYDTVWDMLRAAIAKARGES